MNNDEAKRLLELAERKLVLLSARVDKYDHSADKKDVVNSALYLSAEIRKFIPK